MAKVMTHLKTVGKMKSFLIISFLLLSSCAYRSNHSGDLVNVSGIEASHSSGREIEMGRQIHQAIVSSFRVYTEPRVVGYVTRIGNSIARKANRQDFPYRFTVLYDDRIYATEAPGGFVYVTTGFLNFLQNESELAAVLAHEIGELQYRDPRFSNMRRVSNWAATAGAVVGPLLGPVGMLSATGLVLLNAWGESRIATPEERVLLADREALYYLVKANHDPQGYMDLLSRFLNTRQDWAPYCYDYLSSRPVTLDRYQKVLDEFEKLPLEEKSFSVHRDRFLAITKGVREIYQR